MVDKLITNPLLSLAILILGLATVHIIYGWFKVDGDELQEELKLRWSPIEAVTGTIAIYFWAQVVAAIPLVVIWGEQAINQETVPIKFITALWVDAATITMLYLFLRRRGARLADIGIKYPRLKDAAYVIAGYIVYIITYLSLVMFINGVSNIDINQKQELGFSPTAAEGHLELVFLTLVILPAVTEEIIMRGFLYTGLRSKLSMIQAGLITSILFAIAHLQFGSGNALLWIAAADTFVLSMVLIYLRERTTSLIAPIGLHMLKNGIAFAALFVFVTP